MKGYHAMLFIVCLVASGCSSSATGGGWDVFGWQEMISLTAVVVSCVAVAVAIYTYVKTRTYEAKMDAASLYLARSLDFKRNLAEWSSAFELYGIEIQEVGKKDGVTAEQITYLILSVTALRAYCLSQGNKIGAVLRTSAYREWQFEQEQTRKAWRYARNCVSGDTRVAVDAYIMDKYPDAMSDWDELPDHDDGIQDV